MYSSFRGLDQIGIVVAWLSDDTGEVKGETIDWGEYEYNGQLASETYDRLELNLTAVEVLVRWGDKIYQSKHSADRKARFNLVGHDAAQTRREFKKATDAVAQKAVESAEA